jgi:hypothetical protein
VTNPLDKGIKLCLRDSMKKFEMKDKEPKELSIEVARAFVGPSKMYLNRYVLSGKSEESVMSIISIQTFDTADRMPWCPCFQVPRTTRQSSRGAQGC